MQRITFLAASVASLFVLVACSDSDRPDDDGWLAKTDYEEVTAAAFEDALLDQGAAQLGSFGDRGEEQRWYESQLRRLVVDRRLLEEARLLGADQHPDYETLAHDLKRRFHSDVVLRQRQLDFQPPSTDVLMARFEDQQDRFNVGEQRMVSHIFKALDQGTDRASVRAALNEVQRRVAAGENFQLVAEEVSSSESRHRGGSLGLIKRGHISDDFDELVFSLRANEVSEVVFTEQGGHLFFVSDILPAEQYRFEDVQPLLLREWMQEYGTVRLSDIASEFDGSAVQRVAPELLARRIQFQPNAPVFEVGDYRLSGRAFRVLFERRREQATTTGPQLTPTRFLDELVDRERIYQNVRTQDLEEADRLRLQVALDAALVEHHLAIKMRSLLSRDAARLADHHDKNRLRFSTPLRLRYARAAFPLDEDAAGQMLDLENAVSALNSGEMELQAMVERAGGRWQASNWMTVPQIRVSDPRAVSFLLVLDVEEHAPPFRDGESLVVVRLLDREEPRPQSLSDARARVIDDYLDQDAQSLYEDIAEDVLTSANFEINEMALQRWIEGR